MLGKLIKYEWKSTGRICLILLAVVAGATLLGAVGIVLPARYVMAKDGASFAGSESLRLSFMMMTAMMMFFIYVFSLVGVTYTMTGYQGVHFYKTMYTDEGYLTHTLPVTPNQILLSKTLVAGCWQAIINLCVVGSWIILVMIMLFSFTDIMPEMGLPELGRMYSELRAEIIRQNMTPQAIHMILSAIAAVIISPFGLILTIFGGLTIGQLSGKYKLLLGILAFVGLLFVQSILGQVLRFMFTIAAFAATSVDDYALSSFAGTMDANVITSLLFGGIMYFVSYQILSKKLNLA